MKNQREKVTFLGDIRNLKSKSVSAWQSEEEESRSHGLVLPSLEEVLLGVRPDPASLLTDVGVLNKDIL